MDLLTAEFYRQRFRDCADEYEKATLPALHRLILSVALPGCGVLEIGSGSGREAALLKAAGCRVTVTDGCPQMLAEAIRLHPELAANARTADFPLPDDDPLLIERFDLVLALALIMHLTDPDLERFAHQTAGITRPGGALILSHSSGRRNLHRDRDPENRLIIERSVTDICHRFTLAGFDQQVAIQSQDGLGREPISWSTHMFRKR
ncbi:MAG: class I SAM-dependent methyltransferase [Thermodesulfobacteriota bacterium]